LGEASSFNCPSYVPGEVVSLTHLSRGVDDAGLLQTDIFVSGKIPRFAANSEVILEPYTEEYIQTGPGE